MNQRLSPLGNAVKPLCALVWPMAQLGSHRRPIIAAVMHRRHFLRALSRWAAIAAWQQWAVDVAQAQGGSVLPSSWVAPPETFGLGVASGEPRPDGAVLWTRLAPKPLQPDGGMPAHRVPVHWLVAADEACQQVLQQGIAVADPTVAHAVHVPLAGLPSDRVFYYRFEAGGLLSPVGRSRTAPDPLAHSRRLRLALASCQHYEMGAFAVHREIAQADVDLVLFVGDYIYETEPPAFARQRQHPHVFPRRQEDFTLADYRAHHASYKLDPDLRASHAAHPWLMVWDDHEVANGYASSYGPELADPAQFLRLRTAAYRAYFEHMPLSPAKAPKGPAMRMHDRFEWGQLAELWLVDGRQFRDPAPCHGWHELAHGNAIWRCPALEDEHRSMLGPEQEAWLASGLAASTRAWKLIAQPTQMAPGALPTPLGSLRYTDGWDAYPAARERLMAAIAQPRVQDVVVLGGDVHRHVAAALRLEPGNRRSPVIASEFVASSITSKGLSEWLNSLIRRLNPDLLHMRSDERGYALIDVTPTQLHCTFRGTRHPVAPDATLHTQAEFVVDRGVPGPRRVSDGRS
jgi:alkaline phosphatase D